VPDVLLEEEAGALVRERWRQFVCKRQDVAAKERDTRSWRLRNGNSGSVGSGEQGGSR
jgi:hypothetical protein